MKNVELNSKQIEKIVRGLYLLGREDYKKLEDSDFNEELEEEYYRTENLYEFFYKISNELEEKEEEEKNSK